jgi:hypothetical protein
MKKGKPINQAARLLAEKRRKGVSRSTRPRRCAPPSAASAARPSCTRSMELIHNDAENRGPFSIVERHGKYAVMNAPEIVPDEAIQLVSGHLIRGPRPRLLLARALPRETTEVVLPASSDNPALGCSWPKAASPRLAGSISLHSYESTQDQSAGLARAACTRAAAKSGVRNLSGPSVRRPWIE